MSYMSGLKCRECGRAYPKEVIFVCEFCFGSVEVDYDYDGIRKTLTREAIGRAFHLHLHRGIARLYGVRDGRNMADFVEAARRLAGEPPRSKDMSEEGNR